MKAKKVKIYSKNGNGIEIPEAQKDQWLKNGWSLTDPAQKKATTSEKE